MHREIILLFAPLLMAAATPPVTCGQDTTSGDQLPVALDLSGRPLPRSGLVGPVFSAIPTLDSAAACVNPVAASEQSGSLRDVKGDALHGLSTPDVMRPVPGRGGN